MIKFVRPEKMLGIYINSGAFKRNEHAGPIRVGWICIKRSPQRFAIGVNLLLNGE